MLGIILEFLVILIGLSVYTLFPFFQFYFTGPDKWGISEGSFGVEYGLYYLAGAYITLLPYVVYSSYKNGKQLKSLTLYEKLNTATYDTEFWFYIRSYLLKFIYIPLMFLGAIVFGELTLPYVVDFDELDYSKWTWVNWVNNYIFSFYINAVMTFVLVIYAFSYCVESDLLGNRIKSVDDSWFGWIVTLVCYLPLYPFVFYVIPMASQDTSFFLNHEVTAWVRVFIMFVIGFKAWSIITLGVKSSNLTNRGIVEKGPYRLIRHPHYVSKMMVKWILVLPVLVEHFWLIGGMIFWTTIYMLRALTEEQHLKKDPAYKNYMSKVKWKFIPGVI